MSDELNPDNETIKKLIRVCTGHIPHLTPKLFYTNLWERRIESDFLNFSQKGFCGKIYYKNINRESIARPFNLLRIFSLYDELKTNDIIEKISRSSYLAVCQPVDDTNHNERLFFVLTFKGEGWTVLDMIYIFKWISHKDKTEFSRKKSTSPEDSADLLLYLSAVKVACLSDDGLISVYLDNFSESHTSDRFLDQYLYESIRVICDLLQEHLDDQDINKIKSANDPDSTILPVMHSVEVTESGEFKGPVIDRNVLQKLISRYQMALNSYDERITRMLNPNKPGLRSSDTYLVALSLLDEGQALCSYFRKFIQDLENDVIFRVRSPLIRYNLRITELRQFILFINVKYKEFKKFQDHSRERLRTAQENRNEKILFFTLLVTCILCLLEISQKTSEMVHGDLDSSGLFVLIIGSMIIAIYFGYNYFKLTSVWSVS